MKHLLSIADLGARRHRRDLPAHRLVRRGQRAQRSRRCRRCGASTVVSLFYEDSTRTRLSFETAAKRLSADTMSFSVGASSVNKGESLRDTVETIEAMGVDAIVVRHKSSGVPWQIAGWVDASIVNAGDGWHEHPTQALLDCYTIRAELDRPLDGHAHRDRRRHQALAGSPASNVLAFNALGARGHARRATARCCRRASRAGRSTVSDDLDEVLPKCDVVYLLRMQRERQTEALRARRCGSTALASASTAAASTLLARARPRDAPGPDEPRRRDRRRRRRPAHAR